MQRPGIARLPYGCVPTFALPDGGCCAIPPVMQRFFFHIITDLERLPDPDGQEFPALERARLEARQCARDLLAEELKHGRPLPLGWRVQVAEAEGAIADTIKFADLVFVDAHAIKPAPSKSKPIQNAELLERAKATVRRAHERNAQIEQGLKRLQEHVRTLSRLSASLPLR